MPQHISGDVISRISEVAKRQVGRQFPEVLGREDRQSAEVDVFLEQEDGISIISDDSSEDSDGVLDDFIPRMPVARRGRRKRKAEMLGPVREQRLRTR